MSVIDADLLEELTSEEVAAKEAVDEGDVVTILVTQEARIIGTTTYVHVDAGERGVVRDNPPCWFDVMVELRGQLLCIDPDELKKEET